MLSELSADRSNVSRTLVSTVSGNFPEIHYLVVGSAGRATFVQFVEKEVPVKGNVYVFTETVYEIPAFTEAGAAFEVHIWCCLMMSAGADC